MASNGTNISGVTHPHALRVESRIDHVHEDLPLHTVTRSHVDYTRHILYILGSRLSNTS